MPIERFELQQRLYNLVRLTRDPNVHPCYKPGMKWWLTYRTKTSKECYPNAVSIQEQILVTLGDFDRCFGPRWNTQFQVYFPDFRFNRYNNTYFMTVNVALEQDGYGLSVSHPTADSIVNVVNDRISFEKLQLDLIPDRNLQKSTLFDVNLFLHLKKETKVAQKADNEKHSFEIDTTETINNFDIATEAYNPPSSEKMILLCVRTHAIKE